MIYHDEIEVGKEEILQAVLRNVGTDVAKSVTVDLDVPLDVFNITSVKRLGPEDLSPSHTMSIFFKIIAASTGNFSIEPTIIYFDQKGTKYETPWEPPINIKVNPSSASPLEYWAIVIIPIVIVCIIGIIYLAIRKQLGRYFGKPRKQSS